MQRMTDKKAKKIGMIEDEIFRLEIFNEDTSFFPTNPFRIKFENYYFMEFNSIFYENDDTYNRFISFLNDIGESYFYISATGGVRNDLHSIQFSIQDDIKDYYNAISSRFDTSKNKVIEDEGIYIFSNEVLQYDRHKKFAMVHDRVHDIIVIGVKNEFQEDFIRNFPFAMSLNELIQKMHEGLMWSVGDEGIEELKNNFKTS